MRAHPYVRLALDARFSAFWLGQTISLFGDRLHQIALGVLVYGATNSPLLTGLVFLAATLPNLLLAPIAGTFVDRWDQKTVLVVSDLLRAGLVLLLPLAALQGIGYVYPLVFAVTAVSIFFRPAKAAVVPRIVRPDELMAANSATWMSDTMADLIGFPLAGLFVAFLGPSLPLAFWADSATYVISAVLIVGLAIPPVSRAAARRAKGLRETIGEFLGELGEGWAFLRGQPSLYQNTLISAIAQTSIGATLALIVVYSRDALDPGLLPYPRNWAALETAIGLGNLVGGLAVGAMGAAVKKGWLVVAGFVTMGLATVVMGLTGQVVVALAAAVVVGAANLAYIIPTQTLFAELTPARMMGRVVSFRSGLVYGALTGAMAVSGAIAESLPSERVGLVIAAFGAVTAISGAVAALLPAVRDA
jgi:MFS family permease